MISEAERKSSLAANAEWGTAELDATLTLSDRTLLGQERVIGMLRSYHQLQASSNENPDES